MYLQYQRRNQAHLMYGGSKTLGLFRLILGNPRYPLNTVKSSRIPFKFIEHSATVTFIRSTAGALVGLQTATINLIGVRDCIAQFDSRSRLELRHCSEKATDIGLPEFVRRRGSDFLLSLKGCRNLNITQEDTDAISE